MSRDIQALAFLRRHPVLSWAAAWAFTSIGLWNGGVFNSPRNGPLWLAFVPGVVAWAVAGTASFPFARYRDGLAIWATAYTLAFLASGAFGPRLDFGVFAVMAASGAAAWLGAVVSMLVTDGEAPAVAWIVVPGAWAGGFLIGCLVGFLAAYFLPDLLENTLDLSASGRVELTMGWWLAGALAGTVASLPGVLLRSTSARVETNGAA